MWKVIVYAVIQSCLLAAGQVFLKFALARMEPFAWTSRFWTSVLLNWQFAITGVLFGAASLLWMYIIKHFPLSVAYPLSSLSFVFGMLAAMIFFHENVSLLKWFGVILIICGCSLIAK